MSPRDPSGCFIGVLMVGMGYWGIVCCFELFKDGRTCSISGACSALLHLTWVWGLRPRIWGLRVSLGFRTKAVEELIVY